jgi:NAD(P)-dependent dehydrogenase (short-subunit alcohol dehydrogenase family)
MAEGKRRSLDRHCKKEHIKKCELQRVFNYNTQKPEGAIPLRGNLGIIVAGGTSNPGIGFSFAKEYARAGVEAGKPNYIVLAGRRGPGACNDQLTSRVDAINAIAPGTCIGITVDLRDLSQAEQLINEANNFFISKGVILNLLFLMAAVFEAGVFANGIYDIQVAKTTIDDSYWTCVYTLYAARNLLFANSQNADVTVFFANSITATCLYFITSIYASAKAAMDLFIKTFKVQNPRVNICQMYNGYTLTERLCLLLSPRLQNPINPGPCPGGNDLGLMRFCPTIFNITDGDMTPDEVAALYSQAIERFEEKTYQNLLDRVSTEAEAISDRVQNYGLFISELTAIVPKQFISSSTILVQNKLNKSYKYRKCLEKKIKHPKTLMQEMASKVYSADKCNALGIVGFEEMVNKEYPTAIADATAAVEEYKFLFDNNIFGPLIYSFPNIEDQDGQAPACNCISCFICPPPITVLSKTTSKIQEFKLKKIKRLTFEK